MTEWGISEAARKIGAEVDPELPVDSRAATPMGPVKLACELIPGDVVDAVGEQLLVIEEPLSVHRGLGLFDEFELLVNVTFRDQGGNGDVLNVLLGPNISVRVCEADLAAPNCSGHTAY